MYVIEKNIEQEQIIKNSRFITVLLKITNQDEIIPSLEKIKQKYPKATHYCYGCIIDSYKKASDDKEPSKTAGFPILNVLEKEHITHILAIVVRYFGGIKLGSAGLIRAYSNSVKKCLDQVAKHELIPGLALVIEFDYDKQKEMDYLLRDSIISKKQFQDKITYTVMVKKDIYEQLKQKNLSILSIKDTWIEQD